MSILALIPASGIFVLGSMIQATVQLDGQEAINAVQVELSWPQDMMEVESIDYQGSPFIIKAQETINSGSLILALGVAPATSVAGSTKVATVRFKATKTGLAEVIFTERSQVLRANDSMDVLELTSSGLYTINEASDIMPPSPPQ